MSLLEHAKRELEFAGYTPLDTKQGDDPNKWIQENLLELIEVFSKQGHSGFSASYCIDAFQKLANFKPLSSLKYSNEEFTEVHDGVYQNKRDSRVFKNSLEGTPYFIDAIVTRDQDGNCWHGSFLDSSGSSIAGSHFIKDKSNPLKTFYIDVKMVEVEKDGWESYVVDESQLKEVFEYYDKKEK